MHFLVGTAILVGFVAFAFGESAARGFVQGIFVLLVCIAAFIAFDFYSARYQAKTQAKFVCVSMECLK
jgi:uncharacterized membrane protein required for colicin V production